MRGFAFTLMFVLIASMLLIIVMEAQGWKEGEPEFSSVSKRVDIFEDIAQDHEAILNLSFNATQYGWLSVFFFNDTLPSSIANADEAVSNYVEFVEGRYSNLTNSNISIGSMEPAVVFTSPELEYRYSGWDKEAVSIIGEGQIYFISIRLDKKCTKQKGMSCVPEGDWEWSDSGALVYLDIRDAEGNMPLPGGRVLGFVDLERFNYFSIKLVGRGSLTVYSYNNEFRVEPTRTRASVNSIVGIFNFEESIKAELPLEVAVDGTEFENPVIYEA
ncbi:hypothetical protein DRN67_02075 [Candidatus Micrarchaeota archaeon]|nr:MAG: hypothetical protein DRN67_02075 [Candidatus Micrarchaeota archaeon]